MKFNKKAYAEYVSKPIAVFDEAHKVEDQIIQFIGVDIYSTYLSECHIDEKPYDLSEMNMVAKLLDDLARSYSEQIKELLDSRAFILKDRKSTRLNSSHPSISYAVFCLKKKKKKKK